MVSFTLSLVPPEDAGAGEVLPEENGGLTFDMRSFTFPLALLSRLVGSVVSALAISKHTKTQRGETKQRCKHLMMH